MSNDPRQLSGSLKAAILIRSRGESAAAGLLSRLDAPVTGLLLFARTPEAFADALGTLGHRIEWTPGAAGRATGIDVIVDEV